VLKTFLIQELVPSYFVYSACKSSNMETWHKLDRILDATLTNEVGRKVSISQGSALMRVSSSVFVEIPSLKTMWDSSMKLGTVSFHHAPIFGLTCGALGFDSTGSQRAFMFRALYAKIMCKVAMVTWYNVFHIVSLFLEFGMVLTFHFALYCLMFHTKLCWTFTLLIFILGCSYGW